MSRPPPFDDITRAFRPACFFLKHSHPRLCVKYRNRERLPSCYHRMKESSTSGGPLSSPKEKRKAYLKRRGQIGIYLV